MFDNENELCLRYLSGAFLPFLFFWVFKFFSKSNRGDATDWLIREMAAHVNFSKFDFCFASSSIGKRGNSNFRCSLDAVLSTAMGEVNFASTSDISLAVWHTVFKLNKRGCGENLLKSINSLYTNVKGCSLSNVI